MMFVVPGVPVAQPRQRNRVYRVGGRTIAGNYTPAGHAVNSWKASIRLAFQQRGGELLPGPVYVRAQFVFPRPKSRPKKTSNRRVQKTTKPDADNLLKALLDALNGIAWRDDCQVCRVHLSKLEAMDGEAACTEIEIVEAVG